MSLGNRLLKALAAVLILGFSSLPLGIAASLVMLGATVPPAVVVLILVLELAVIAALLWFAKWQSLISFDRVWWSKPAWTAAGSGYLGMLAFSFVGSLIMEQMGQTNTANQALLEEIMAQLPTLLMFISVVITAPLAEELACRSLIPDIFSGRLVWLGYLIGTLVFAYLHGPTDLGSWVIYGGMGLVLSLVRYKTGRLEYAILAHGLNNGIAFLLLQVFQ